jgi:hypothetical protein
MLPNGACFWRLPISAFFQKSYDRANVPDMQTHELELWNCFSYWPSVHRFDWLAGINGKFLGINKKFYHGNYLFTVDWGHPETNILDVEHSEIPQEHKCAHILALTNGNFAAQPNNRILWHVKALDKAGYMVDNLIQRMSEIKMNYYFTGALIVMLVVLAFCGGPGVQ